MQSYLHLCSCTSGRPVRDAGDCQGASGEGCWPLSSWMEGLVAATTPRSGEVTYVADPVDEGIRPMGGWRVLLVRAAGRDKWRKDDT